ncbi:MAG: CoA pyrophosphatase [Chloroflexi bacterium]|nr:CoA pyrophosphatase [Chloroflexota bacterium]
MSRQMSSVTIRTVIEKLRKTLAECRVSHITDSGRKVSMAPVPIFLKGEQYHILFLQRTGRVKSHKGQISFPGETYEEADGTLLSTALREAGEEVGLAPRDVKVLGELDDMAAAGTRYVISPLVGLITYPFRLDRWETEELIEVSPSALLDNNCRSEGVITADDEKIRTHFYHYGGKVIWGATARILKQFLGIFGNL